MVMLESGVRMLVHDRVFLLGAFVAVCLPNTAFAGPAASVAEANVKTDRNDQGQVDVTLGFDVTFSKKPAKSSELTVKARCTVGAKKFVDTGSVIQDLDDVDAGDTKRVQALVFNLMGGRALPSLPQSCEFTVRLGQLLSDAPSPIGSFCWDVGAKTLESVSCVEKDKARDKAAREAKAAQEKVERERAVARKKLEPKVAGDVAACKKGDGARCVKAADFYAANIDVLGSSELVSLRAKACELKNADGCYWVARSALVSAALAGHDRAHAVEDLVHAAKTACDAGNHDACHDATRYTALEDLQEVSGDRVVDALKKLDDECANGDRKSCAYAANQRLIASGHVDGEKQQDALVAMCTSTSDGWEGCRLAASALRLWGDEDAKYIRASNEVQKRGCDAGDVLECHLTQDFPRSHRWPRPAKGALTTMDQACVAGDFAACSNLGGLLMYGVSGSDGEQLAVDSKRALPYLRAACWAYDTWACAVVTWETPENDASGRFDAFSRVCSYGSLEDCQGHSEPVSGGPAGSKAIVPLYLSFFTKRCDARNATACFLLGRLHDNHFNGAEDYKLADTLHRRACEYGSAFACHRISGSPEGKPFRVRACQLDGKLRGASLGPGCK